MHEPYVVCSSVKQTASVIFLHGLGDTGKGWSTTFNAIRRPHVKYIFPNGPIQPVTLNLGMEMPSWFDIYGLSEDSKTDEEGIKASSAKIRELINAEITAGIPANRIVLGGFSQGGALALYTALTHREPLAGVVALSSWLPLHKEIHKLIPAMTLLNTRILQCHSEDDNIVPFASGRKSSTHLQQLGFKKLQFKAFKNMGHGSSDEEIAEVQKFLDICIGEDQN